MKTASFRPSPEETVSSNPEPSDPRPRVLCVEGKPCRIAPLLEKLNHRFIVTTAKSGPEALRTLSDGTFPVIVSDLRVPELMHDAFVKRAQSASPESSHVLLVGPTELEAAVQAMSDGRVFRVLRKPFSGDAIPGLTMSWRIAGSGPSFMDKFEKTLDTAVRQFRLVTADKALLSAELEKHKDQLLHSERLATLGTLAAGVGHELNNIATVLIGVLPFIHEQAQKGEPPHPEDLRELDRVSEHLRAHGSHLLNLGRPREPVDLNLNLLDIIEATLAMLNTAGKTKMVALELDFPSEAVTVCMDQTRLEQILVNLIGNACDAVAETGDTRKPKIRIVVAPTHSSVETATCTIEDNGCGISSEQLAQIFEPYFTTKPPDRGTGLGLPVVKQIIESYGGQIQVTSREGDGTTFKFDLPKVLDERLS